MRSRGRRTLIGAVFSCLVVMGTDANAESVPLPVPVVVPDWMFMFVMVELPSRCGGAHLQWLTGTRQSSVAT